MGYQLSTRRSPYWNCRCLSCRGPLATPKKCGVPKTLAFTFVLRVLATSICIAAQEMASENELRNQRVARSLHESEQAFVRDESWNPNLGQKSCRTLQSNLPSQQETYMHVLLF